MADKQGKWRYAVVGNIVKTHMDEEGILRYGSRAFTGGTKVYLGGKLCDYNRDWILVIGKNRFGRYVVESIEKDLIENIRWTRVYKPVVLQLIDNDYEFGEFWWADSDEDLIDSRRFYKGWLMMRNRDKFEKLNGSTVEYIAVSNDFGWIDEGILCTDEIYVATRQR